jgi:hypothetical protein
MNGAREQTPILFLFIIVPIPLFFFLFTLPILRYPLPSLPSSSFFLSSTSFLLRLIILGEPFQAKAVALLS